jgi:transposase
LDSLFNDDDHRCRYRSDVLSLQRVVSHQERLLKCQERRIVTRGEIIALQEELLAKYRERLAQEEEQLRQQGVRLEEVDPMKAELEELRAKLSTAKASLESMERRLYGMKSEKMPPVEKELRKEEKPEDKEARRLAALEKRRTREALKANLRKQTVIHHLVDDDIDCPKCGGIAEGKIGEGKRSSMYEYVPGYFVKQEHVQEKAACRCGQYIATADPPHRPFEKGLYGPGFVAHLVTMKCADSIPLYRLAKQYQRLGIPMARSTLTDLFHAAARKLTPLTDRLIRIVAESDIVQADETPMKMLEGNRRGFIWTFLADNLIAYRFAASRSGSTPAEVLGGTKGTLVVDAYSGYNRVTEVDGRDRAGCLAHARRKIFEALGSAPVEARQALDMILAVYRVEHEAKARGIVRTPEHLHMRQTKGRAAMEALKAFLDAEKPRHLPKGPMGIAIGYMQNQWERLVQFLDDVRIPIDNNASERALRVVALGRKNFLFVGDEDCGANLAGLYSLVSTCEANDVDPVEYLKDVIMRVDTHPARHIDELLPHKWTPPIRWVEAVESA